MTQNVYTCIHMFNELEDKIIGTWVAPLPNIVPRVYSAFKMALGTRRLPFTNLAPRASAFRSAVTERPALGDSKTGTQCRPQNPRVPVSGEISWC